MKYVATVGTALVVLGALAGGALAQTPPPATGARTPDTIQGQVVKIDPNTNRVTIRAADGTTHEFEASRETLQDLKPGDRIEAKRRPTQTR